MFAGRGLGTGGAEREGWAEWRGKRGGRDATRGFGMGGAVVGTAVGVGGAGGAERAEGGAVGGRGGWDWERGVEEKEEKEEEERQGGWA